VADDPKQSAPGLSGNAFIWLLALISGTVLITRQAPYQDARPAIDPAAQERRYGQAQDIDARLWQDPFAAVDKGKRQEKETALVVDKHGAVLHQQSRDLLCSAENAALCLRSDLPDPLVLGVMISGGRYATDSEFRRRTRYAVLSGLDAEGYKPEDAQHLGAVSLDMEPLHQSSVVPFEWFYWTAGGGESAAPKRSVLVLWLDEDAFQSEPLCRLAHLRQVASHLMPVGATADIKIIGPQYRILRRPTVFVLPISCCQAWISTSRARRSTY
jgi:hypothetical protein